MNRSPAQERHSSILTRWPVLQEHPVTAEDLDANGRLRDEAVERWTSAARLAYIGRCAALREIHERPALELRFRTITLPSAEVLGHPTSVVVTAHVTEILPTSLAMTVRIRPIVGGSQRTLDAAWVVSVVERLSGEVLSIGDGIRADLIELERGAEHYN